MPIVDALLPEYDQEMATTRRVLERVADNKFGWKPHAKSWTMKELATHVATIPSWIAETMNKTELDYSPAGAPPYQPPDFKSRQEMLTAFDQAVAAGRSALFGASDEAMLHPWTLLAGGTPMFTMPRAVVLRSFVLNHSIHHRAQLGVYLRLNDIPVPQMYGPTADEQ